MCELHESQLLYTDTDSLLLAFDRTDDRHRMLETGSALGELSSEVPADETLESAFFAGGKCYVLGYKNKKFTPVVFHPF